MAITHPWVNSDLIFLLCIIDFDYLQAVVTLKTYKKYILILWPINT